MKPRRALNPDSLSRFGSPITVRAIAQPLVSFDDTMAAHEVCDFLDEHGFDAVGVRREGRVVGYALREELRGSSLGQHVHRFTRSSLLAGTEGLAAALTQLASSPQLFVTALHQVCGIVTRGDLHRAPVRLWVFGTVTCLESEFFRLIRSRYPESSWARRLIGSRVAVARRLFAERQKAGEETDLAECLCFGDKVTLMLANAGLAQLTGIRPRARARSRFARLEKLRNRLAHGNSFVDGDWAGMAELMNWAEEVLRRCAATEA